MGEKKKKRKVIIRRCDEYREDLLRGIIREGMEELGARPRGRILIKPNVVTANTEYIHHSYTQPLVVESMVGVLRDMIPGAEITVGESGGIGIPTRLFFRDSGFRKMAGRIGVPLVDFNEEAVETITLKKAKWHKTMLAAKSLYEAEYKIWMPKLKFHIVTQITNALKLNIGILTHRERFLYHDDRLNEKVVDLLEPGYPDLIVTDAVTCGRGFESSPYPFHLGAILMATDPIASDVVAAHILGYKPAEVLHLVEAHERGYGDITLSSVDVTGDVSIDELSRVTRGMHSPFQNLQELETPLRFYEGTNRDTGRICFGGCICSIKGGLGTAEKKYPGTLAAAKDAAIVMGFYRGDVIHPGGTVALIGDCAGVEGRCEAKKTIRIGGCPVKVKDLMLFLLPRIKVKSPAFDPVNMVKLIYHSVVKALMQVTVPVRPKARIRHRKG